MTPTSPSGYLVIHTPPQPELSLPGAATHRSRNVSELGVGGSSWLTDRISLGVLAEPLPRDLIEEVLNETGRREQWSWRDEWTMPSTSAITDLST